MSCSITNLGSCLVEKFFEFIVYILNLPVKPLLALIENLMTQAVNISLFSSVWAIMVYMLSLFYGILIIWIGLKFLISGHSPEERDKAKRGLTNILLMIVLVQSSFILYQLAIDIASSMTAVMYQLIGSNFFVLTSDSFSNIGLEIILLIPYLIVLVITIIFLTIRYICVSIGVVFVAVGIFLYYIGPFQAYGKLILNYLGVLIFLPFIYSIVLLACSKFLEIGIYKDIKIVVMIGAFTLVNLITLFLILFVIFKAANAVAGPVSEVVAVAGMVE